MNQQTQEPVGSALVALETSRLPITQQFAQKLEITPTQWRVLIDQIYPTATTVEAVTMALTYCRARKLDIFKKPIHIVKMWSSAKRAYVETCWVGISEIRTTASRTKQYAGIDAVEFGPTIEHTFTGKVEKWVNKQKVEVEESKTIRYPEWASVVVYRLIDGQRCAFYAKVYWLEAYASIGKSKLPNEMWEKRPYGQVDKCVEAAALRKAFPEEVGNEMTAEEMEGRVIEHGGAVIEHEIPKQTPAASRVPPPAEVKKQAPAPANTADPKKAADKPKPAEDKAATDDPKKPVQQQKPAENEIVDIDPTTGEVIENGDAGVTNDVTGDDGDGDGDTIGDYFERMDAAMSMAFSEADVEEVWSDFDPLAKFENDDSDDNQSLAKSIRRRHMSRVAPKG